MDERAAAASYAAGQDAGHHLLRRAGHDEGREHPHRPERTHQVANDVVLQGRKVCGVLLEAGFAPDGQMFVVIGSGLNVRREAYPPELAERAVALEELCPPPGREALIAAYLNHLEAAVDAVSAGGFAAIEDEYRALSCTLGQEVQVLAPAETFTGTAIAVDETGALLVRTQDNTTRRVLAGDVSVRGMMGYV